MEIRMAEIIKFRDRQSGREDRYAQIVEEIGYTMLAEVTDRYGDGYPDSKLVPSVADLPYHNMHHTMHVRSRTREMVRELGMSPYDGELAVLTASAHDIVHGGTRGVVERRSAEWLIAKMRSADLPEGDITACELGVLGTEPIITDGAMTGQKVTELDFPDERAELIAKAVACADMAELYAPHGPRLSRDLYKEQQGVASTEEPSMDGIVDFQCAQVELARSYRYPHQVGEKLFAGQRNRVVAYHEAVLESLVVHPALPWQALLALDQEFERRMRA